MLLKDLHDAFPIIYIVIPEPFRAHAENHFLKFSNRHVLIRADMVFLSPGPIPPDV
jgi:hypothetical protein